MRHVDVVVADPVLGRDPQVGGPGQQVAVKPRHPHADRHRLRQCRFEGLVPGFSDHQPKVAARRQEIEAGLIDGLGQNDGAHDASVTRGLAAPVWMRIHGLA